MTSSALPDVMCIGQARLTAGLDRLERIDLNTHFEVFGTLPRLTADQLIGMAEQVELRGRGGAAFPVGRKVKAVVQSARQRRRRVSILVNGTEGEPGSAKDRMLLLRSPCLVLGGAMVAAWALQAKEIVVSVTRADVARSVSAAALAEPNLRRLVRVVRVPDRFVTGEAGALVNAVNGRGALPPGRKILASDFGINDRPTLLSNAETFAQIAVLAMLGPGRLRLDRDPGRAGNGPAHGGRLGRAPRGRGGPVRPAARRGARPVPGGARGRRPGRRLSRHVAADRYRV